MTCQQKHPTVGPDPQPDLHSKLAALIRRKKDCTQQKQWSRQSQGQTIHHPVQNVTQDTRGESIIEEKPNTEVCRPTSFEENVLRLSS